MRKPLGLHGWSTRAGNLYKTEVLFLRGIDPSHPVGGIADLTALVDLAQRLLEANKNRPTR